MPKAGIIFNDSKPVAEKAALEIKSWLTNQGWEVLITTGQGGILGYGKPNSPACHTPIKSLVPSGFDQDMSFAISLGGDGTVLSAFRQIAPKGIPLLTINTGHMGFLTEIYLSHLHEALEQMISGSYVVEQRSMIAVQVFDRVGLIWEALSLNEMVLHREPLTSMCHFEITIGKHTPVDVAADGVIISTPTGSTAYALSAGGPVIEPGIPVLQLVPICPHSMASRALVFSNTEKVIVKPANQHRLVLVVDGNAGCYVYPDYHVKVERSPYAARFIRLERGEFLRVLREKLGWGLPHISKPTSVELP
ncbi:putative sugar kinase [Synechococcus sp. PCC 7502]|uniref:NAD(+) kinase n=1 Tax=Synechococcus sp. PCC 7502 TaxID=1173263 RepID=UPI00029FA39C|nr:NAD(+) kinase [Synechococcus sp. PCC 7502]AFY73433.1 putative sugar kinase [Synechococcus sp. PCC 7502]